MIIAISGKKGSGKDTISHIIQYLIYKKQVELGLTSIHYTLKDFLEGMEIPKYKLVKFAEPIITVFKDITGLQWDKLDRETKEMVRPKLIEMANDIKEAYGEYVFLKCIIPHLRSGNVIISDLRFNYELSLLSTFPDVFLIKVNRFEINGSEDISETDLDDYPFENVIENNSSIDDLVIKVEQVLKPIIDKL